MSGGCVGKTLQSYRMNPPDLDLDIDSSSHPLQKGPILQVMKLLLLSLKSACWIDIGGRWSLDGV